MDEQPTTPPDQPQPTDADPPLSDQDQAKVEQLAGVPDGTELQTTTHDGQIITEVVVADTDDQGNVIGWHKEAQPGA